MAKAQSRFMKKNCWKILIQLRINKHSSTILVFAMPSTVRYYQSRPDLVTQLAQPKPEGKGGNLVWLEEATSN